MIFQALMELLFLIVDFIISLLPQGFVIPDWLDSVLYFFKNIGYFIPPNSVSVVISVMIAWYAFYLIWLFVHWIIRKIPGIQ